MDNRRIQFDYSTILNSEVSEQGSPERNMLMSLLERAILDYVGNNQKEIESAESWIFDDDNENNASNKELNQIFSFKWICFALDLDHNFVRDTIKAMPKRGKNKVAPWYFDKEYQNNLN